MKQPTPLCFVPRRKPKRYRLRFSLRALLLLMTCVGPFVLVAIALPKQFYITLWTVVAFEVGMILVMALLTGTAWCASFVRPGPLAICFVALTLISAALGISLFVGHDDLYAELCAATAVGVCATFWTVVAFGLSWSRHAQ